MDTKNNPQQTPQPDSPQQVSQDELLRRHDLSQNPLLGQNCPDCGGPLTVLPHSNLTPGAITAQCAMCGHRVSANSKASAGS
jgi:endogenous inhibitor of DNA gyrase (YacG/DUF329 family)